MKFFLSAIVVMQPHFGENNSTTKIDWSDRFIAEFETLIDVKFKIFKL